MVIKVISLNIWGGSLYNSLLRFLAQEKPDILMLQELYHTPSSSPGLTKELRLLATLADRLSLPYTEFAPLYCGPEATIRGRKLLFNKVCFGNAILCRWPLVSTVTHFFDVPFQDHYQEKPGDYQHTPRNLQQATVHLPDHLILDLFNIHGIWGFNDLDSTRRWQMIKTIQTVVNQHDNVILAGDFNMSQRSKGIQRLGRRLTPVFRDHEHSSSFNMKRKSNPILAGIMVDHAFISGNLTVSDATCPPVDVSDHRPLVMKIATSL